ncbi:shikimate dehydrogenase [Paenibacillus dakarensis]|uniref:shikimate dehydrogenase n=1 Tax=Paenibacillus dakarensis TaxID=1527293 RepID=UPI0006D52C74|nr:shikimate dehydrogenase [Paenibacillus dakarensis]
MSSIKPSRVISNTGAILLGVMGDPIVHSKSPVMHTAALKALGIAGNYVPLHVKPEGLESAIQAVRSLGFRGVNVTIPHKVEVMKYLDNIDEGAARVGAVNTIVNNDGVLTGYNTDGIGYVRSLKEEACPKLQGLEIVVLGAGGAARGIIHALTAEQPGQISVVNRTASKAIELAREWSFLADIRGLSETEAKEAVRSADVLINTTSVGMHPHVNELPVSEDWIPSGIVVSDLIYNPLKTKFLQISAARGCTTHGGLGMFVNQGAYALEYWTGQAAPVEIMKEAVLHSFTS